jgi:hypothetical protein
MLSIFKKIFFKLFPGQNTIKVSAKFPTSSGPYNEPTGSDVLHYEPSASAIDPQLFLDPAPLPVESVEAAVPPQEVSATEELPVVEESKPVRTRNKGRFVADNKLTDGYNEAWVNGKAPVKKNNKKKKK